jgi:hypothetical protein
VRLTAVMAEERAAQQALRVAQYALERVQERRRALELKTCIDCVKLRKYGRHSTACQDIKLMECTLCKLPFCRKCFLVLEVCSRCDGHDRCRDCCVERHGEDGDGRQPAAVIIGSQRQGRPQQATGRPRASDADPVTTGHGHRQQPEERAGDAAYRVGGQQAQASVAGGQGQSAGRQEY